MAGTGIGTVFQNLTKLIFKKNETKLAFSAADGQAEIALGEGLAIDEEERTIYATKPTLSDAIDNTTLVLTIEQQK